MAIKTITGLTAIDPGNVDDTIVFPVDDNALATRKMALAQLRTALGLLAFTGDVEGSGNYGEIELTIAAGAVALAQLADMATNRLLGRSTAGAGAPELIEIGAGLSLVAGVLSASAPAGAAPSATLLTHRTFGGL